MKVLVVFAAVAIGLASAQVQGVCPTGFLDFSDDALAPLCLMFQMFGKGTWNMQRADCQSRGADLAVLEGALHFKAVTYINAHPDMTDEGFWIGGSDAGHEGTFTWIDDSLMPMGTPHWYLNQPNGGSAQNYVGLYTPDFYFHDLNNDKMIYSICQI